MAGIWTGLPVMGFAIDLQFAIEWAASREELSGPVG
jgi:hypothetical protein